WDPQERGARAVRRLGTEGGGNAGDRPELPDGHGARGPALRTVDSGQALGAGHCGEGAGARGRPATVHGVATHGGLWARADAGPVAAAGGADGPDHPAARERGPGDGEAGASPRRAASAPSGHAAGRGASARTRRAVAAGRGDAVGGGAAVRACQADRGAGVTPTWTAGHRAVCAARTSWTRRERTI